jgi:hypothetical protein
MLAESNDHTVTATTTTTMVNRSALVFSVSFEEELIDEFHGDQRWRWRSEWE